jgi:hypothetical protein
VCRPHEEDIMGRSELDAWSVARVIAAFGFDAVRGRTGSGTGAAPAHRLAELRLDGVDSDKRTVAKKAMRGIPSGAPPTSSATPFDFAMAALFDWSRNDGQASFEAALDVMRDVVVPLPPEAIEGAMASLLRMTVDAALHGPDGRFLTGFGVQVLALDYVHEAGFRQLSAAPGPDAAGDESLAWAKWLLEQRRIETRQTSRGYEAVLSLALLLLRRRPKPGVSIAQIVRAAQSAWVGGVQRAFLLPEEYPEYGTNAPRSPISPTTGLPEGDGQIERAMVDLIDGMTEESLFSVNQTTIESRLVAEGLRRYRSATSMVALDPLIEAAGADAVEVREYFPTDEDFAGGCLHWLAGVWEGFGPFAEQFRAAALAGVEALLEWVDAVHHEFPVLLMCASFATGDPAFDEVVSFISVVLSRTGNGARGMVGPDEVRRARRGVEAAATGGDWRRAAGLPARKRAVT